MATSGHGEESAAERGDGGSPLRAVGSAFGIGLLGIVVAQILGSIPVVPVILEEGGVPETLPLWALFGSLALTQVGHLGVGYGYVRRSLGGIDVRKPTGEDAKWLVGGLVVALAANFGISALAQALEVQTPESVIVESFAGRPAAVLGFMLLSLLLVGPAEELLFRGAVQRRLSLTLGRWPAVVLASLFFLLPHGANYFQASTLGFAVSFGTLFVVAVILGYVYERTENLLVPMVVHGVYNAMLGATLLATL